MKRCVAVLLALVMLLSLCACSQKPSYKGDEEELQTVLGGIASIPVATMGASMTVTARTVELLDWCEATAMSGEELAGKVKAYYDAMDADAQMMFQDQVMVTVNCAANLSDEGSRASVLNAAGFSDKLIWDEKALLLAVCIDDLL